MYIQLLLKKLCKKLPFVGSDVRQLKYLQYFKGSIQPLYEAFMSKQYDSWCSPLHSENQPPLYGGAARNVRVARSDGMDVIRRAVKEALEEANLFVTAANDTKNVIPMKKKTKGKNS